MKVIKINSKCIFVSIFITFVYSCSLIYKTPKPEHFGIYLVNNNKLIELNGQVVNYSGNLINSIAGIKARTDNCLSNSDAYIIHYSKDISYKSIILTKLKYQTFGVVDNILRKQMVDVNMWVQDRNIELKVAPIEGENNMYKLIPTEALETGYYAINYGNLDNQSVTNIFDITNQVYPFCFGDLENEIMEFGISMESATFYTIEYEYEPKKEKISNFLIFLDAIEEVIKNNFNNIYYGIYPLLEQNNIFRFHLILSRTSEEMRYKIFSNLSSYKFSLLSEYEVRGVIGFLFKGGGIYTKLHFNSPTELETILEISDKSYILQSTYNSDNEFHVWLSADEYSDFTDSSQVIQAFFKSKLDEPASSYDIRYVELVQSRYNVRPFVK